MSIISFFKAAGEKLFGHKEAEVAATQAQAAPDDAALQAQAVAANQAAAASIVSYIRTQNLPADDLTIEFDGATGSVMLSGWRESTTPNPICPAATGICSHSASATTSYTPSATSPC